MDKIKEIDMFEIMSSPIQGEGSGMKTVVIKINEIIKLINKENNNTDKSSLTVDM